MASAVAVVGPFELLLVAMSLVFGLGPIVLVVILLYGMHAKLGRIADSLDAIARKLDAGRSP